jgi:hypothetical protein
LDPGTDPATPPDPGAPADEGVPAEGPAEDAAEGPADGPAEGPAEDPGARRRRGLKRSAADMVRSMLVIVGIVVVIVLVVPRPSQTPQRAIDVATVARGAALRLSFAPAVPRVPAGWSATSAEVRNSADGVTTWHIGYLTADGNYASIEQAAKVTPRWEEIMDSGGTPREPQTIDGTTWEQRYKDVRDVYALIHRGEARTTMVTSKGGGLKNATALARSIPAALR